MAAPETAASPSATPAAAAGWAWVSCIWCHVKLCRGRLRTWVSREFSPRATFEVKCRSCGKSNYFGTVEVDGADRENR